ARRGGARLRGVPGLEVDEGRGPTGKPPGHPSFPSWVGGLPYLREREISQHSATPGGLFRNAVGFSPKLSVAVKTQRTR
ncbi:hypothetical protein ACQF5U_29045, partial [Klebsiella pneumoniae]